MKKTGILNSDLAKLADDLGHTDRVCIGDLGLPVPNGVKKIDLSLTQGTPSFQDVLDVYLENILVEKVLLAEEIKEQNPKQLKELLNKLDQDVTVEYVSHEELKELNKEVKAVVRTGENTPYSNIILQSGVTI
ncbi:D-ribose pyranase [Streptococcus parauberis]|uniref:D-ribose pyranase n=1 Tax=Streptococcus parauberis TaxID=1348 RepID=A0A0E2UBS1_9STRE|nr:D-ribose pyranase [Streptococcus parauberis]AEF25592.1 high affinity ribose transport protein RbsD [Streptococcus parauberis KCTC 11537]PCH12759.1 D-ribose pyranase [Streptococcus parauberis]UWM90056.1 D-ribose pyranase [Streptococcus parauberis]WEM63648.1 D-ribose pyranase [Streptococcus parauberis]GAJ61517.1 high affinity ribose transport protein RbsD [Streptococcus parauberis]